ncbi:MAG: hypothetical protein P1V36_00025 [Planctomycetota bacterium]|nr:hypothetical protein [Planctomycetota bacterium]
MSEQYGPTDYYAVGRYVTHGPFRGLDGRAWSTMYEIERMFENDGVTMVEFDGGTVVDYESLRAHYDPVGHWDEYDKWEGE